VLRNLGLNLDEIAANLSVVVAQRLVRRLCPQCRTQLPIREDHKHWFRTVDEPPPKQLWHPVGCA
jgi:type II secretory ATPase GspE/PulE/Tfp pilus assembly ATPase PilB-like protein